MTNRVLVPTNGSEPSAAALEFALERYPEAMITALYVVDPMLDYSRHLAYLGYTGPDEFSTEREKAEAVLESMTDRYEVATDRLEREIAMGKPARVIIEFVEANHIDQIILGNHGRDTAARILLGSVAETVVRRASVPVTVVR